jgi:cytochrome c oxidase assembly factor CtaG
MLKALVTVGLLSVGAVYACGWCRLCHVGHPPPRWRPMLYVLGLAGIAAALLSPIEALADELFPVHMVQHLLLTMVAAPLLLLGNPLPVILWGVPVGTRRWLARPLTRDARFRRILCGLTSLPIAWLVYVVNLWTWHLPGLYQFALEHEAAHVLEHAAFFSTALLFWWPIIRPAPRLRPRTHPGFEVLYLIVATAQNTALGMLLTISERSFYRYYEAKAARLGVSAVDEQVTAGGIMWVSGHMYLLPILLLLYEFARQSAGEDDDIATQPDA